MDTKLLYTVYCTVCIIYWYTVGIRTVYVHTVYGIPYTLLYTVHRQKTVQEVQCVYSTPHSVAISLFAIRSDLNLHEKIKSTQHLTLACHQMSSSLRPQGWAPNTKMFSALDWAASPRLLPSLQPHPRSPLSGRPVAVAVRAREMVRPATAFLRNRRRLRGRGLMPQGMPCRHPIETQLPFLRTELQLAANRSLRLPQRALPHPPVDLECYQG